MTKNIVLASLILVIAINFISAYLPSDNIIPSSYDSIYSNQDYSNFIQGDANGDGIIDQLDAEFLIAYIFHKGPAPNTLEAGDANEDGVIDISDAVYLIDYLNANSRGSDIKGDANGDGIIDQLDAEFLTNYIFHKGPAPKSLEDADINNDGNLDISDVVALTDDLNEKSPVTDTTAPIITLYNPEDGSNYNVNKGKEKNIAFDFKIEDMSSINYCSLIVDNYIEQTNSNVNKDLTQIFYLKLPAGNYQWKIKCEDVYGNVAFSNEKEFSIKEKQTAVQDSTLNTQLSSSVKNNYDFYIPKDSEKISLNQKDNPTGFNPYNLIPIALGVFMFIALILTFLQVMKK
jgi:hypothetical protein